MCAKRPYRIDPHRILPEVLAIEVTKSILAQIRPMKSVLPVW
jgi:hypothetical protein